MFNLEPCFKDQFAECAGILKELMRTEFKAIKEPVRLLAGRLSDSGIAETYPYGRIGGERVIILSIDNWADNVSRYYGHGRLSYDSIREDLRHELLHLELKRRDSDPEFIREATQRGIKLKGSIERRTFL